jgi:O-methyltransferase involved in polyketide biosynthesis
LPLLCGPRTVEEKNRLLADAIPRRRIIRHKVDLLHVAARQSFLDEVLADAPRTLVITEGFLLYLENRDVESLALELAKRAQIVVWIADIVSPGLLRKLRRQTDTVLAERLASATTLPGSLPLSTRVSSHTGGIAANTSRAGFSR